ncbi:MAG: monophosphatase [Thermoleophilaceae bacterium]|nr:monophosphatase [Thermoleophilaceae bacterium]
MLELVRELSLALREEVLPLLGSHAGRAHAGELGAGGDVTFKIDERAEALLESWLAERAPDLAFYSEDRGLVVPPGASEVLVVDPIDGTRPAMAGLESCCVSVAAAPLRDGVTMGEVTVGCVVEIPSGAVFLAERGRGVVESPPLRLSHNERIDRMFWTYGFRGRPVRPTVEVIGDLLDRSSVGGGSFELGSACYDMTRVATGQLDCYVEAGPRLVADVPGMEDEFRRVGGGELLNNSPYDLAAAALVLEEAGAIVTDAYGQPLADRPLLGSGGEFQMSIVVAANRVLHDAVLAEIDAGVARLRAQGAGGRAQV